MKLNLPILSDNNPMVKKYLCQKCGQKFSYTNSLKHHTDYVCGKPARFQCIHCDYRTKLKGNLKKHVLSQHKINA